MNYLFVKLIYWKNNFVNKKIDVNYIYCHKYNINIIYIIVLYILNKENF